MGDQTLAEMLDELRQTQQAFFEIVDQAPEEVLYHRPAADSWSLAEALVHIAEARQFFCEETRKIMATPGAKVGRTLENPHRLRNVNEHGRDAPDEIRHLLLTSYEAMVNMLTGMRDDDLRLQGEVMRFGPMSLADFIGRFIVGHDKAHVEQARALLAGQARTEGGSRRSQF